LVGSLCDCLMMSVAVLSGLVDSVPCVSEGLLFPLHPERGSKTALLATTLFSQSLRVG
jgi:hypothetical protein